MRITHKKARKRAYTGRFPLRSG